MKKLAVALVAGAILLGLGCGPNVSAKQGAEGVLVYTELQIPPKNT